MNNTTAPFDLLILDYGGVYSFEYNLGSFDKIIRDTFGMIPEATQRKKIDQLSQQLAAGQLTSQHYVVDVANILEVQTPLAQTFEDNTIAVTHDPSPEMVQLVGRVKRAGINVALLSNMYAFEVMKTKSSKRYDGFDYVAFSAETHFTKSDPNFFLNTIEHFTTSPSRTLFVDDMAGNVDTASKLGIGTIHADKNNFTTAEDLANSIRQTLQI